MTFTTFLEQRSSKHRFSCLLYHFSKEDAKMVYDWGLKNIPDSSLFVEEDSYGREDEIHCTVLYGLHAKTSTETRKLLADVKPFEIKLGTISLFESEKYDVLKVGVTGKALHDLHHLVRDNLEVTLSFPDYKPHVTIGYVKKGKGDVFVGNSVFDGKSLKVGSVVFSSHLGVKSVIRLGE